MSGYCDNLMKPEGQVGQSALALNFLTKHYKNNLLTIKYKDLCSHPEKTIKSIYKFLDVYIYLYKMRNPSYFLSQYNL